MSPHLVIVIIINAKNTVLDKGDTGDALYVFINLICTCHMSDRTQWIHTPLVHIIYHLTRLHTLSIVLIDNRAVYKVSHGLFTLVYSAIYCITL